MITNKLLLAALVLGTYVLDLLTVWWKLYDGLVRGLYPPNVDSIGIAAGRYFFAWLFGIPLVLVILYGIRITHLSGLTLTSLNEDRRYLSIVAFWLTIVFGQFLVRDILGAASDRNIVDWAYSFLLLYTVLCLRVLFTFWGRLKPS